MVDMQYILHRQTRFGRGGQGFTVGDEVVSYEDYLDGCRRMLTEATPSDYYNWSLSDQQDFTYGLILSYVQSNFKLVDGHITVDNELDQSSLVERIRYDIMDFGILRDALEDPRVQEIQINDYKTIWVVINGKTVPYVSKDGRAIRFVSDDELHSVVNRLVHSEGGSARMTQVDPLINTRTVDKGYRLSGVNNTAITPDITVGNDFECTSITIRKYAPSMLTFDDFERFGSLTPEMSAFLRLCGRGNISLSCVGATSSGKTTLLNGVCWEVDPNLRLILIQNPTEIMIYDRDPVTGANRRNVLHWEAKEVSEKLALSPSTPTMGNFIAHALRNTPDVIIPGEVRTPVEFSQMLRAAKTGHRVLTTWHANDGPDAVDRAAMEVSSLGGSVMENKAAIASSFDIIVTQEKLGDGSRKVTKIEELTGHLVDGRAETRVLFEYVLSGRSDIGEDGRPLKLYGYFRQVNSVSDKLVQKFYAAGVDKSTLDAIFGAESMSIEGRSNLRSQAAIEDARLELFRSRGWI